MSDVKLGSWTVAESPLTIEYSLVVLDEIRHAVTEGYQRLSRGGIEVGGILYGTHEGDELRITAMRSITCEHARGPAFLLSDKDRKALHEQLQQDQQDPRLEGMVAVGWFLSHTRTEILLSESDLEIYSIFFPASWQVTLVVRPGRGGTIRAGFFVREPDGMVKTERSYLEFNLPDRLTSMLDRLPRERGTAGERRASAGSPAPDSAGDMPGRREGLLPSQPTYGGPQFLPSPPPGGRWKWILVWVVLALAVGASIYGLRNWMARAKAEPIALGVLEREGQLQIEWNHAARPVYSAARGSLEIIDGPEARTIALTPQILSTGKFTWVRKTGDVEVRMTVEDDAGGKVQEATRFLGKAPEAAVPQAEAADLEERRTALEAELTTLRQENAVQAARIQTLERTLRILQTRLGVDTKQ